MKRGALPTLVVAVLGVLSLAPTAGDVGGCGSEASLLDVAAFSRARKQEDCEHCTTCGLTTSRCVRACDPKAPSDVALPATCRPLLHDGEVCIRAIHAGSCTDWAKWVDETAPTIPSECEFCRVTDPPSAAPLAEGGAPR